MPLDVHPHRARLDRGGDQFFRFTLPAQDGAHAGHELGDVVVGAEFQAYHLVDLRVLGREHDDRHGRPLAQLPADLGARGSRQLQVQEDQVGSVAVELHQGIAAVVHYLDVKTFFSQEVGQGVAEGLLVLNYQYPAQALAPCSWAPLAPGFSLA